MPTFLGKAMLEAGSWTPFECLKTVIKLLQSRTAYYLTGKLPNNIKDIIYLLINYCIIEWTDKTILQPLSEDQGWSNPPTIPPPPPSAPLSPTPHRPPTTGGCL